MSILGACMVPHPPIILPEVGRGEEKKIAATTEAYREVAKLIAELKPDTIVLSSPHTAMYADYFHLSPGENAGGSMAGFGAPQVQIASAYDRELVDLICQYAEREDFPAGILGERDPALDHGTMIPLYFMNQEYTGYRLVRIGLSGQSLADHYRLGEMVRKAADALGRRIFWVGSGDLSHKLKEEGPYGFTPEGPDYDTRIMEAMGDGNFGELFDFSETFCDRAAECGHRSFVMMAGALDGLSVEVRELSHEDIFGVGYGVCTYRVVGTSESRHFLREWEDKQRNVLKEMQAKEDPYVKLARKAMTSWIRSHQKIQVPEGLPPAMTGERAGTFVSLHKDGRLRGCIGTITPVQGSIAEEIISNAISASTRDPRFAPVRIDELDQLSISVDVLGATESVESPDQLDVKKYGVVVSKGFKRGLLLPNLDGIDTVEEQLAIAKQKAGIEESDEDIAMERFEVIRHY